LKKQRDPEAYEYKRQQLQALVELYEQGFIELFFVDEVTFSLVPCVPYGWLPIGEQVELTTQKATVMKLLGLVNLDNRFYGFPTKGKIDALYIINAFDQLIERLDKPTVLVLDNASFHRKAVELKRKEWEEKNLFIFFLPTYSPHLNRIEILWRFVKHQWLKAEDYLNSKTLWNAIENILNSFGKEYTINFSKQF